MELSKRNFLKVVGIGAAALGLPVLTSDNRRNEASDGYLEQIASKYPRLTDEATPEEITNLSSQFEQEIAEEYTTNVKEYHKEYNQEFLKLVHIVTEAQSGNIGRAVEVSNLEAEQKYGKGDTVIYLHTVDGADSDVDSLIGGDIKDIWKKGRDCFTEVSGGS